MLVNLNRINITFMITVQPYIGVYQIIITPEARRGW